MARTRRAAVAVLFMVRQASEFSVRLVHSTPQPYGRLVETYPDQIRALLQWGLQNRDQLVPTMRLPACELSSYMISELGRVGDTGTVALLHSYVPDRELGPLAVHGDPDDRAPAGRQRPAGGWPGEITSRYLRPKPSRPRKSLLVRVARQQRNRATRTRNEQVE